MLSINPPTGKWTYIDPLLLLFLDWEADMDDTKDPVQADWNCQTDLGALPLTAYDWPTNRQSLMTGNIGAVSPTWLNLYYLGPTPRLLTGRGTQVEAFTLTNVPDPPPPGAPLSPDPPWLQEQLRFWASEHEPPPGPGSQERHGWMKRLAALRTQMIADHENGD